MTTPNYTEALAALSEIFNGLPRDQFAAHAVNFSRVQKALYAAAAEQRDWSEIEDWCRGNAMFGIEVCHEDEDPGIWVAVARDSLGEVIKESYGRGVTRSEAIHAAAEWVRGNR